MPLTKATGTTFVWHITASGLDADIGWLSEQAISLTFIMVALLSVAPTTDVTLPVTLHAISDGERAPFAELGVTIPATKTKGTLVFQTFLDTEGIQIEVGTLPANFHSLKVILKGTRIR